MAKFVHACNQFQEKFDCAVLVVHHVGKDKTRGGRGSSALRGAVDTELLMEKNEDLITFSSTKTKDSPPLKNQGFRVESRNVMKNGNLLADKKGLPVTSAILIETPLSESSESSSADFSNRQRGRHAGKTDIAVDAFKRLKNAYGDRDVKLSELRSTLFKEFPNEFNSGAWRDNTGRNPDKGKAFKKRFEFNQSEDWIKLRNDSDSENKDEEDF
jgi:putative DNA primase/helicase